MSSHISSFRPPALTPSTDTSTTTTLSTPILTPSSSTLSASATTGAQKMRQLPPGPANARINLPMQKVPCKFYVNGYCARGEKCWFLHDTSLIKPIKRALNIAPASTAVTSETKLPPTEEPSKLETKDEEVDKCCICLDPPTTYGLLPSCDHVFCLVCIRQWRAANKDCEESDPLDLPEPNLRVSSKTCPICRTKSHFVVPSSTFPLIKPPADGQPRPTKNFEKDLIVTRYLLTLKQIPCKYFISSDPAKPYCQFGNQCHYSHPLAYLQAPGVLPKSHGPAGQASLHTNFRSISDAAGGANVGLLQSRQSSTHPAHSSRNERDRWAGEHTQYIFRGPMIPPDKTAPWRRHLFNRGQAQPTQRITFNAATGALQVRFSNHRDALQVVRNVHGGLENGLEVEFDDFFSDYYDTRSPSPREGNFPWRGSQFEDPVYNAQADDMDALARVFEAAHILDSDNADINAPALLDFNEPINDLESTLPELLHLNEPDLIELAVARVEDDYDSNHNWNLSYRNPDPSWTNLVDIRDAFENYYNHPSWNL